MLKGVSSLVSWSTDEISVCIIQAIASPVSGMLGDRYDRTKVIAAGCIIWGVMTSAIAMSSSVLQVKS